MRNTLIAIVDDGHKLLLYPAAKLTRLYHLESDQLEIKSVFPELN